MKAARIALRTAVPLAGTSGVNSSRAVPREVEQFSRFSPSPLSIKQLLDFGERRDEPGRVGGLFTIPAPGRREGSGGTESRWGPAGTGGDGSGEGGRLKHMPARCWAMVSCDGQGQS